MMNPRAYESLFEDLGFTRWQRRRKLQFGDADIPTMYFNCRDEFVWFAVRTSQIEYFDPRLWMPCPPPQLKDEAPNLRTLVPLPNKEREALMSVLEKANMSSHSNSRTVLRVDEGSVAVLTLNRPEAFNAFNEELLNSFVAHTAAVKEDPAVRAVVITGAGKAFCAGGDLKALLDAPGGSAAGFIQLASKFHEIVLGLTSMPKAVIAAVNGVAAGGGFSLALACDFRVMAKSASLKCAYGSAGLSLDGGGSWTLPRLVGRARALEFALLDKPMGADACLSIGLATRVVDDGAALSESMALAHELAAKSSHATGWAKQLINRSSQDPFDVHLDQECLGIAACGAHPDGQEGMRAFAEKRKPNFNS